MSTPIKLKFYFDEALANKLAEKLKQSVPSLNHERFVTTVAERVNPLELKDRVSAIADALHTELAPGHSYKQIAKIFIGICGPENPRETGMFTDYYWLMPIARYVEVHGLNHLKISLETIEEITKRHTGEFAIRPFLERYPEQTLARFKKWASNRNSHVRRLASEGLRPRLPWAKRLTMFVTDPSPIFPILDMLKADASPYVRKSVANNINDILKDNYSPGMELLERWAGTQNPNINWCIKHALRNRRKHGDPRASELLKTIS